MSEQDGNEATVRVPRGRSPSYPGVSLRTAVERARTLYDRARHHPVPRGTITGYWGYKAPTTGPASVTYAALKKFGLLDEEGEGAERVAKLSELALDILHNPESRRSIQKAALLPPIHQEMWAKYGPELPSADVLHFDLVIKRGFTERGLEDFIREYRDTVEYAELPWPDNGAEESPPSEEPADVEDAMPFQRPVTGQTQHARRRGGVSDSGVLTIPVPVVGSSPITIEGSFPVTETAWSQFIAVLEAMKPGLVSESSDIEPDDSSA